MISRAVLALLALLVGCAIPPPPAPKPIVCDEIDRAPERFPEECGEQPDAGQDEDAGDEDAEPAEAE